MPLFPFVVNNDTFPNTRAAINAGFAAHAVNDPFDGLYNGQFFVWSRGPSVTISSNQSLMGGPDGWSYFTAASSPTVTLSRQSFALGDTLGSINSRFYMRLSNAATGSPSLWMIQHNIPNVAYLSGRRATISFWARATYAKTIAVQVSQNSGTAGQNRVTGPLLRVTLTTNWQQYHASFDMPSVAGWTRVVGAELLAVRFWLASSTANSVAGGNAFTFEGVGDIDIAEVRLDAGDYARDQVEIHNPNAEMLAVRSCEYNHYQVQDWRFSANIVTGTSGYLFFVPLRQMRIPLNGSGITISHTILGSSGNMAFTQNAITASGVEYLVNTNLNQPNAFIIGRTTAITTV